MISGGGAKWNHTQHLGEPLTFLLCCPDGGDAVDAVDAVGYLDALCHALQRCEEKDADSVNTMAVRVYQPLSVYVGLLEDPEGEPTSLRDGTQVALDEWSSMHLAVVMRHVEAVTALLAFHQQHASSILEDIICDSGRGTSPENDTESGTTATAAMAEKTLSKSQNKMSSRLLGYQAQPELGGAIAILENGYGDENAVAPGGGTSSRLFVGVEPKCAIFFVTGMLQSLLQCVVYERNHQDGEPRQSSGGKCSPSGLATGVVRAHCDTLLEYYTRFPSLIVEHDVMYEACHADLATLNDLMQLFNGLLLPVLRGRRMPYAGASSRDSSTNTTPWETQHAAGVPWCGQQQQQQQPNQHFPQASFILSCAAQEHHKLAFLVTWINLREAMSMERHPPGSARKNREANVLSDFCVSLWNLKKSGHVVPSTSLWSGHVFVLSRLVSSDCPLERFIDIVEEGDYAMYSSGMTASFIAVMVAGAVVSAFPEKCHLLQLLCKKVKTLLVDVPGVVSLLRHFVSSPPANDRERFDELWLAATPLSRVKKFTSRAEMLSFASLETVLLGAEKLWSAPGEFSGGASGRAKVQRALQAWIGMCRDFFVSLRDRPFTEQQQQQQRRAATRSLVDNDTATTISTHTTEDNEVDVLRRVCDAIPQRLQYGDAPCHAIYTVLYPNAPPPAEAAAAAAAEEEEVGGGGGGDDGGCGTGNGASDHDLEAAFAAAQATFSRMAADTSNNMKLKFYGLYKQATIGDINVSKPWMMDAVGRAKWDAWNQLKGMGNDDAKRKYISELRVLQASAAGGK